MEYMNTESTLIVHPIFDQDSHTFTYVVSDPVTKKSAVIDSVLEYNHKNVVTDTELADQVVAYLTEHGLKLSLGKDCWPKSHW